MVEIQFIKGASKKMMHTKRKSSKAASLPHFRGTARKVELRTDLGNVTRTKQEWASHNSRSYVNNSQILTFRVELTDNHGNIIGFKQVILEGEKIFGIVCDGDTVEVIGKEDTSGIYNPVRILNLTTGTEISANPSSGTSESSWRIAFFILGLLLTALVTTIWGLLFGGLMFLVTLVFSFTVNR